MTRQPSSTSTTKRRAALTKAALEQLGADAARALNGHEQPAARTAQLEQRARNPLYDESIEQTADGVACALTYLQLAATAMDQDGGGRPGDDAVMGRQLLMRACSEALLAHSRSEAVNA